MCFLVIPQNISSLTESHDIYVSFDLVKPFMIVINIYIYIYSYIDILSYPIYIAMENPPIFKNGKPSINGPFPMAMSNNQMVYDLVMGTSWEPPYIFNRNIICMSGQELDQRGLLGMGCLKQIHCISLHGNLVRYDISSIIYIYILSSGKLTVCY